MAIFPDHVKTTHIDLTEPELVAVRQKVASALHEIQSAVIMIEESGFAGKAGISKRLHGVYSALNRLLLDLTTRM